MKITSIKEDDKLWSVMTYVLGNTSMKSTGVYPVSVIAVDRENNRVLASWNGNAPQYYYEFEFKKWKKDKPILVALGHGRHRLATRAEIKAMKENETK